MSKDFIQNSADWEKWRFEGLGASDAPVYFEGETGSYSKYKTRKQLCEEKILRFSKPQKNTFIADMGHAVEDDARGIMELNLCFKNWTNVTLKPTCAVLEKEEHLRASLDGYSDEIDLVWECKMCGKKKYEMIKEGECPDDFYIQTHHQMMVTSAKKVLLTAVWLQFDEKRKPIIDYKNIASIYILRDDEFIKELKESANKFWNEVIEGRKRITQGAI